MSKIVKPLSKQTGIGKQKKCHGLNPYLLESCLETLEARPETRSPVLFLKTTQSQKKNQLLTA